MSYYCRIRFNFFARPVSYTDIVRTYLASGWVAGHRHPHGLFGVEWRTSSNELESAIFQPGDEQNAFRLMQQIESASLRFTFNMVWSIDSTAVELASDPSGHELNVYLYRHTHTLPDLPQCADHNWYIPKLLGPLERLGCVVDILQWDEHLGV